MGRLFNRKIKKSYENLQESFNFNDKELKRVDYYTYVNAKDILGINENEIIFPWHDYSREDFVELTFEVQNVINLLESHSMDYIKNNTKIRKECIRAYFDERNIICLYKYKDKYVYTFDGRHRIYIAKKLELNIPVKIIGELFDL